MTTDLDRLIEAVEAGTLDARACGAYGSDIAPYCNGETITLVTPLNAFGGDLNAAVALLEALLPGVPYTAGRDSNSSFWATVRQPDGDEVDVDGGTPTPARALLLATLRAYRSTREGG